MTDASELQRCAACDARNPAGAAWCGQCYAPMAAAPAEPATPTPAPPAPPPAPAPAAPADPLGLLPLPPSADSAERAPTEPRDLPASLLDPSTLVGGGRFRETGAGLQWSCGTCEEWNALELVTCSRCHAPFGPALGGEATEPVPTVEPALLLGASFVLPGAGHALLQLWGEAFTRMLLALVWGIGGVTMLVSARSSGQPALPAVPLLVGWAVLALASVNDAQVAGTGQGRVLLQPRRLLWLVVTVVVLTMMAAVAGAFSAVGG